jgi:hypothetical protein
VLDKVDVEVEEGTIMLEYTLNALEDLKVSKGFV